MAQDDNKTLRELGLDADIIYTPGHTYDSMNVLFDDGTAVVGDACMNFMLPLGANYLPIYYMNQEMMYKSIEKLISRGTKIIVSAHGKEYDVRKLHTMLRKYHENR